MRSSILLLIGSLVSQIGVSTAAPDPVAAAKALITPPPLLPKDGFGTSPAKRYFEKAADAIFGRQVEVCGYLDGVEAYPLTCGGGYECGINSYYGIMDCCVNPGACPYHTVCLNAAQVYDDCGASCESDLNIMKCIDTASISTECLTIEFYLASWSTPFFHYECASEALYLTAFGVPSATPANDGPTATSPVALQETAPGSGDESGNTNTGNGNGNSGSNDGNDSGNSYDCQGQCVFQKGNDAPAQNPPPIMAVFSAVGGALILPRLVFWLYG